MRKIYFIIYLLTGTWHSGFHCVLRTCLITILNRLKLYSWRIWQLNWNSGTVTNEIIFFKTLYRYNGNVSWILFTASQDDQYLRRIILKNSVLGDSLNLPVCRFIPTCDRKCLTETYPVCDDFKFGTRFARDYRPALHFPFTISSIRFSFDSYNDFH